MALSAVHTARLRQGIDGALFALALTIVYVVRAHFPWADWPALEGFAHYAWLLPLVALLGPGLLTTQGLYDRPRLTPRLDVIFRIARACAYLVLGLILGFFLLRVQFARSVIILGGGLGGLLVYARHEFDLWRRSGPATRRRVWWLGTPEENQRVQAALSGLERESLETVGEGDPATITPAAFTAQLHAQSVNVVVVSLAGSHPGQLTPLLEVCEREGVEVLVRPGLFASAPYRVALEPFAGEPMLCLRAQAAAPWALVAKQVHDYVLAALLLLPALPLLLLAALAVRLSSPGPVLFRQPRAGLNGRPFLIYKLRTMRVGAEAEQAALAAHNELRGPAFKLRDDPRLTPVGRFLRRHSLDELPQLWNVLRGEMSLVGPRPLPVEEVARIADSAHRRRLSVKPGITGLWQVSGRNDLADFADWVRLDLAYIDQWSLWLDLKILLATLPVALLGRGSS
jgi:exopolysaccharide biosynthesis polyprenyl glycosylphosphotransferase